jgi:hypothetical protein
MSTTDFKNLKYLSERGGSPGERPKGGMEPPQKIPLRVGATVPGRPPVPANPSAEGNCGIPTAQKNSPPGRGGAERRGGSPCERPQRRTKLEPQIDGIGDMKNTNSIAAEFGGISFGDKRLDSRFAGTAEQLGKHVKGSVLSATGGRNNAWGLCRLLPDSGKDKKPPGKPYPLSEAVHYNAEPGSYKRATGDGRPYGKFPSGEGWRGAPGWLPRHMSLASAGRMQTGDRGFLYLLFTLSMVYCIRCRIFFQHEGR